MWIITITYDFYLTPKHTMPKQAVFTLHNADGDKHAAELATEIFRINEETAGANITDIEVEYKTETVHMIARFYKTQISTEVIATHRANVFTIRGCDLIANEVVIAVYDGSNGTWLGLSYDLPDAERIEISKE